jgi:hypothetical protein
VMPGAAGDNKVGHPCKLSSPAIEFQGPKLIGSLIRNHLTFLVNKQKPILSTRLLSLLHFIFVITATSTIAAMSSQPYTVESITAELQDDDKVKLAGIDTDGMLRG